MSDTVRRDGRSEGGPARGGRAFLYCLALTVLALGGAAAGVWWNLPVLIAACALPAAVYELIRTEGLSTKLASFLLVGLMAAELAVLVLGIEVDLAKIAGIGPIVVGGYRLPLGDVRVVGAAVMAILSVVLFMRTRGIFTKWLAVVLFASSFAFIYSAAPDEFGRLLGLAERSIRN